MQYPISRFLRASPSPRVPDYRGILLILMTANVIMEGLSNIIRRMGVLWGWSNSARQKDVGLSRAGTVVNNVTLRRSLDPID